MTKFERFTNSGPQNGKNLELNWQSTDNNEDFTFNKSVVQFNDDYIHIVNDSYPPLDEDYTFNGPNYYIDHATAIDPNNNHNNTVEGHHTVL